ncbi:MAG: hypothetical protein BM485_03330 [Desulfobulbaceae bacterium DB1]|nr:MAG: hypothetical protein BM485_03330 [Desulfobulbaceae bacterium DB1]
MKEQLCSMTSDYAAQPTTSVTLEMPVALLQHVKKAACLEGCNYQDLITCYVNHGLINSQAQISRKEFAEHAKEVLKTHGVHSDAITEVFNKLLY